MNTAERYDCASLKARELAIKYMGRKVKLAGQSNWIGEIVGFSPPDINDVYAIGYVLVKSINPPRSYIQSHRPRVLIIMEENKEVKLLLSSPTIAARYPQICPKCGGPAYIGALQIDCYNGC